VRFDHSHLPDGKAAIASRVAADVGPAHRFAGRSAGWSFYSFLSVGTFITTVSTIPFMPDGWNEAAGFPAMQGNVAFLMKDVVLLAVSVYLLQQDLARALAPTDNQRVWCEVHQSPATAPAEAAYTGHIGG
jgi:hypothetical protein